MAARTPEETRRLLVDAGVAVLRELTVQDLVTAIGTRTVAGRAGVSPATLFHHFGTVDGFAAALLDRIYAPDAAMTDAINAKVREVEGSPRPTEAGVELHRLQFQRIVDDPMHRLRVGLWALGGEDAAAAYDAYVEVSDRSVTETARRLHASWGREVRPPFDMGTFISAQAALLTGAVTRHPGRPDDAAIERFARTAAALSLVMLRVPGDQRDVDDRLAEINHYAARGRAPVERSSATRDRVLDAADELVSARGFHGLSLAQVARAAHVSVSTAYALFEGKDALAVALVRRDGAALAPAPVTDPQSLRDRLTDVARVVAARSELVGPWVTRLVTGALPADDPLATVVVQAVREAQDAGIVGDDLTADDLGSTLLTALVGRVLRRPAEGPVGAVDHVLAARRAVRMSSSH